MKHSICVVAVCLLRQTFRQNEWPSSDFRRHHHHTLNSHGTETQRLK